MDLRLMCETCGVKWFVPAAAPPLPALPSCAACGGKLAPLGPRGDDPPRGWTVPQG